MPGIKTIYSRDGTPLTDIRASVSRSSLLNDIGEAVFLISTSDVKCKYEYLNYGNYLYCQNDSLPDWIGMIDTPRTWKHGYVECHAFEPMSLLQYRTAPLNGILRGTPGARFSTLLEDANNKGDTLLRTGIVFTGGINGEEITTDTSYSHIKSLSGINKHDWICTPQIGLNGKLTITIDWLERAGITTDLELSQGHNILYGDVPLEESGTLINYVQGVSDVGNENGTTQIVASYTEQADYGLRQARIAYDGITDVTTLLNNCTAFVKENITPSYGTPLTIVNVGSTFANIKLGNIVKYKYTNVGFDAGGLGVSRMVRILGYMFNEAIGTVELYTGEAA